MRILFGATILLFATRSFAASCCGGGFAFPALILGDDKAQVTTSYSYSTMTDHALSNGQWTRRTDDNRNDTLKLDEIGRAHV